MSSINSHRQFILFLILLLIGAVLLNTVSGLFDELIRETLFPNGSSLLGHIAAIVVLLVPFYFIAKATANRAGKILGAEVTAFRAEQQPALNYLLMGFSPNKTNLQVLLDELESLGANSVAGNSEKYQQALDKAKCKNVTNQWQQNLRAIWHHKDALKAIYVLDNGENQYEDFESYLRKALELGGEVLAKTKVHRIIAKGNPGMPFCEIDGSGQKIRSTYEDYNYVYGGLSRGLEMITEQNPAPKERTGLKKALDFFSGDKNSDFFDRLTCVDATPGQKTFSVAAAVITLNRPLKFCYVTTYNAKAVFGEVRFYDTRVNIAGSN